MTYFKRISRRRVNNGGLPSNDNNNDTAKHNVSGHNAHLLVGIILAENTQKRMRTDSAVQIHATANPIWRPDMPP